MDTSSSDTIPMFRATAESRMTFVVTARGGKVQLVRRTLAAAERSVALMQELGYSDAHVHIGARKAAR